MQSLQAAEVQMEGEIALDSVGESSTACERFSDDEAESPTTNQSFLDDDGGASLDPALPLSRDENLMVWMRAAPMPRFRKLYGRIEHNLHAGQIINVSIANVYNTYSFNGSKSLVLTTTSFLGGKNPFLGRAYLMMGVLCTLMALVSILVQLQHPREFGDHSRLTWNRQPHESCTC
jgi:hypothetical protein